MKLYIVSITFICFFFEAFSQSYDEQLEIKIDNDLFVLLKDKYYTSGLFFTYRKNLEQNLIFNKTESNQLQLNITLGNQTYTPQNLQITNTSKFDRPYAGWLFLNTEVEKIKTNASLSIGFDAGITGEPSLSRQFQTVVHNTLDIDVPVWEQQIEFKFLVNLKARYTINRNLGKFNAIQYSISSSLGTKDIFLQNAVNYTFGRMNNFNKSARNNFIDNSNTNEFFGFISAGYKYVGHNTLIQGSLDYNDQTFTSNSTPHIIVFKVGSVIVFKRNTLRFIFNFNTKETPTSTQHAFGSLSYSLNF